MMPVQPRADRARLDPESARWVDGLSGTGRTHDETVERLHALLLRVAHSELNRRADRSRVTGPELEDLAHQVANDAVLAVTRKIATFRGESRFTTWAYRFVVLEVSATLGRHFWRRPDARLDAEDWATLPDTMGLDPAVESEWRELVDALHRAVDEVLTERQRRVFVAIVLAGVPLDAVVIELQTNRNAVYKVMFDARRKIRAALVTNGYLADEPRQT